MRRCFSTGLLAIALTLVAMSASAETSCQDVDFNENGVVDDTDVEIFKILLGKTEGEEGYVAAADLDGSGSITPMDFRILLSCR